MSLTGRQGEADRPAGAVGDHASLGAIAATRAAKRFTHVALGSRSPFLGAPAALWCALIDVPSRKAMPNSTPRSWTRSRSCSQTPSLLQRMKVCAARHQIGRHAAPFRAVLMPPDNRLDRLTQRNGLRLAPRPALIDQRPQHRPLLVTQDNKSALLSHPR